MAKTNRYLEAFKESYNTIGLATVVAVCAATGNPLPLLGALVAEAVYLLFVPDSKWYDARLSSRYDDEVIERRRKLKEQVFPSLSPGVQARFTRLEMVREQINSQVVDGRKWFREVLRKLDYLLEKFLLFAQKEVQFERYLQTTMDDAAGVAPIPPIQLYQSENGPKRRSKRDDDDDEDENRRHRTSKRNEDTLPKDEWIKSAIVNVQASYDTDLANLDNLLTQGGESLHNNAVLEKRKEVLTRRREYIAKIGETLINLGHQLQLIQDTFGLINDEIRARSPEQVLADIDDVVFQTDNLTDILENVAPFDTSPLAQGASRLYNMETEETK